MVDETRNLFGNEFEEVIVNKIEALKNGSQANPTKLLLSGDVLLRDQNRSINRRGSSVVHEPAATGHLIL